MTGSPAPKRQKTTGYVPPSLAVLSKLGDPGQLYLSVWVETNRECQHKKGYFDHSGLYSTSLEVLAKAENIFMLP